MLHKWFQEMGIPEEYAFKQLLYHPVARTLIVQVQGAQTLSMKKWVPDRLHYRRIDEEQYKPIGAPLPMMAQEYPVISSRRPLLAYNATQWRFSQDPGGNEHISGDWDSLKIYDLEEHQLVHSISKQTLIVPDGVTRCWIASVLGFSEKEDALFVTAGLSKSGAGPMDYHLANMDIEKRSLHLIAQLPAVFM